MWGAGDAHSVVVKVRDVLPGYGMRRTAIPRCIHIPRLVWEIRPDNSSDGEAWKAGWKDGVQNCRGCGGD